MNRVCQVGFIFFCIFAAPSYAGAQVSITNGGTPGSYSDLAGAFSAINSGIYTGTISITITANISSVSSTASLSASGSGFASYSSVSIQPTGNYTLSGSVNGPLIRLNGADNVTIDGVNSGGKSLTISNTNTATGHAIQFTAGATVNSVINCTLQGSNQTDAYGVISFKGTSAANSNIIISNNRIGASSGGTPAYGIYADGDATGTSSTVYSSNVTVSDNAFSDYASNSSHSFGIYVLNGHSSWTIMNNRFYQTASRSLSVSSYSYHGGIWVFSPLFGNFSISFNTIGYASSSATGTYTINTSSDIKFIGITLWVTTNSGTPSYVNGNTINNISFTTASNGSTDGTNSSCGVFTGIWARSGNIYLGNSSGNTIGGSGTNSITISVTNGTSVNPRTLANGITYGASGGTLNLNTVASVWMSYGGSTNGFPMAFNGINCTGTPTAISGNVIGSTSTANSILAGPSSGTVDAAYPVRGIFYSTSTAGAAVISGNTVANIVNRSSATDGYLSGIDVTNSSAANTYNIYSNTVQNLHSYSSRTAASGNTSVCGMVVFLSGKANIYGNTVYTLRNQNTSVSTPVSVIGAFIQAGTSTSTFYANRIYDLGTTSSTPGSVCTYLYVNGNASWNVHNNMISAANSLNKTLTGIQAAGSSTCTYYYNSIYLGGSNSFTSYSTCFERGAGTQTLYNNIFYNDRVSSGTDFAVVNSSTSGITANYNFYVATDTAAIFAWNASTGWANYYTNINSSDLFSWAEKRSNINVSNFFTSVSTGDLSIVTTNRAGWYVNGKGMPLSSYDYDWELAAGDRSAQVSDGATDIGADEFATSTTPLTATHVGSYVAGTTSAYYFAGKKIAEITWQNGSNLPSTQPTVSYYSGTNPPYFSPGALSFNAYWNISAIDPGGMSYALKLWYSDAIMGGVTSTSNLRMAKNSNGLSTGWACAMSTTSVNTATRTFANTASYNNFSVFTGTDLNNPLPVEWLYFEVGRKGNAVKLDWATASEMNSSHFEIERSENGKNFVFAGSLDAAGYSTSVQTYNYTDEHAGNGSTLYYRLKQVDRNNDFAYSPIRVVKEQGKAAHVYPNPFTNTLYFDLSGNCEGITIFDVQGHLQFTRNGPLPERFSLPIPDLPAGIYSLHLRSGSEIQVFKLVHP